jgi:hypothetical protein
MTRRHLVRLALLTAACFALGPALARLRPVALSATTADRLVATLRHPKSAAAIGRAYLDRFPERGSVDRLVAGLGDVWQAPSATVDQGEGLKARLQTRIRDDFAHGRTVAVEGWILAESEVRLYALAALLET